MKASNLVMASALIVGGLGSAAQADLITFTTDACSFGAGGDTLSNPAGGGAVNVPQNGSVIAALMNGSITIGDSGSLTGDFPFTMNPGMIANSVAGVLNLDGHLAITPAFDAIAYFNAGAPTVFNLGGGLLLTVTPLPLDLGTFNALGSTPYTIMAEYHLNPTPGASAVLGIGLLASSRRRRA